MIHLFPFLQFADDTALWLVWGSLILSLFTSVSNLTAAVPIIGFGGAAASLLSFKKTLRYLGLLPALAALALCRTTGDYLLIVPALVYLLLRIRAEQIQPNSGVLDDRFRGQLAAAVLGGLFCVFAHRTWAFRCAILAAAGMVYLMRVMRHTALRPKLAMMELVLIGSVCAVCLLLSSDAALQAGLFVLKKLYFWCIYPILYLLLIVLSVILRVIDAVISLFVREGQEMPAFSMPDMGEYAENVMPELSEGTVNPWLILAIQLIGIALFLVLAWVLFRYLRKGTGNTAVSTAAEKELQFLPEEHRRAHSFLDRSPEASVRRAYAAYCRELVRHGITIYPSDTSRSLAAYSESTDTAGQLRQIYLQARYNRSATPADAKLAANLSRQLRKELH